MEALLSIVFAGIDKQILSFVPHIIYTYNQIMTTHPFSRSDLVQSQSQGINDGLLIKNIKYVVQKIIDKFYSH
jgi:flagellar biosynthesis protein FliQ